MCRVLSYLGKPILTEELLYEPDNSFIKQSYNPRHMSHLLNLAGFGLVAWDQNSHKSSLPYVYKTSRLPFYDENLRNLAVKINPHCLITHIRGVPYSEKRIVSEQNIHPFKFEDVDIVLAHNGALAEFEKMKFALLDYIKPEYQKNIKGTTDSEWIYAVYLSQLANVGKKFEVEDIANGFVKTLEILQKVRKKHDIAITSPVNLFISNGEFIAATRFVLDYGWHSPEKISTHFAYHSLWYTYGESYGFYDGKYKMKDGGAKSSIIIASEPLTEDTTTWIEVPEYSFIIAWRKDEEIEIFSQDISF